MKEKIVITWDTHHFMLNGSRTNCYQIYIKELVWKGKISITTNLQESMHDDDDDDDTKTFVWEYTIFTFIPIWHTYVHMHACMPARACMRTHMQLSTFSVFLKCYIK